MWITAGNESGNDITAAHRAQPATFYPLTKRKKFFLQHLQFKGSASAVTTRKKNSLHLISGHSYPRGKKKLDWLRSHNNTLMKQLDVEHMDRWGNSSFSLPVPPPPFFSPPQLWRKAGFRSEGSGFKWKHFLGQTSPTWPSVENKVQRWQFTDSGAGQGQLTSAAPTRESKV